MSSGLIDEAVESPASYLVRLYHCCSRFLTALVIVTLTTWAAFCLGESACIGEPKRPRDSLTHYATMVLVPTGAAGLGALCLWWNASTPHILKATHFLVVNWVGGLASLGLLNSNSSNCNVSTNMWVVLRILMQVTEFVLLQGLIQHRFQSFWPVLNQPRLANCLPRMFKTEVFLLVAGSVLAFVFVFVHLSVVPTWGYVATWGLLTLVLLCFFTWVVLVVLTLCSVVRKLHAAERLGAEEGSLEWCKACRRVRRAALLQGFGMTITLMTTTIFCGMAILASEDLMEDLDAEAQAARLNAAVIAQIVNLLVNVLGVFLFSGAYRMTWQSSKLLASPESSPCKWQPKSPQDDRWEAKTKELASRGLRLRDLLAFYKRLGQDLMLSYEPGVHTTQDVVRLAIIPETSSCRSSYAQLVNPGAQGLTPRKMVTHNWSNLFRDLLASVVADALGEHTIELFAQLLEVEGGVYVVEELLEVQGSIDETYWICAFAVNQHSNICGGNPKGDVDSATQRPYPICPCAEPKFFNKTPPLNDAGESIGCELNKFDDMMAYLFQQNPWFAQVVAVDAELTLFTRAWCVAELAQGQRMGMAQSLKLRNKAVLLERKQTLECLKVEEMQATRPADKDVILSKIKADFGNYANFDRSGG
ncbi:unnamed protein product [Durusdinium trenchii]|uniref:Uncharacterized protein n=1 Tax=Durusdinium trenchii TaxID=1381693 RepID=A0ABP0PP82_9DINO